MKGGPRTVGSPGGPLGSDCFVLSHQRPSALPGLPKGIRLAVVIVHISCVITLQLSEKEVICLCGFFILTIFSELRKVW